MIFSPSETKKTSIGKRYVVKTIIATKFSDKKHEECEIEELKIADAPIMVGIGMDD